jgi:NAD-dependent dihydropyrimidine dehydrogenase PreA subunit
MALRYLKNVVTLSFDSERCVGCGKCAEVCPRGVFSVAKCKARITSKDSCMECGACSLNCPAKAIAVNAGVGCAAAIIKSWFTGGEPACDCSGDSECC